MSANRVTPFGGAVPLSSRPLAEPAIPDVVIPCVAFNARAAVVGPAGDAVFVLGLSRPGTTASAMLGREDVQKLRDACEKFLASPIGAGLLATGGEQ